MDYFLAMIHAHGYYAIFICLTLGIFGIPIPDEAILSVVGVLILKGRLEFLPALSAAWLGSCVGISLSYVLGRTLGHALVVKFHGSPEKAERVRLWFDRRGKWTLVFGYYIPGVRHLTALVAGSTQLKLSHFALFAFSGALIWTTTFISLGYFLGDPTMRLSVFLHQRWLLMSEWMHYVLICAMGVALLAAGIYFALRWLKSRRRPDPS